MPGLKLHNKPAVKSTEIPGVDFTEVCSICCSAIDFLQATNAGSVLWWSNHILSSSLSLALSFFIWQCNKQYLEKSNILCCKFSMAWLIRWNKAIRWVQSIATIFVKRNSLFSIVCDELNAILWQFWKHHFRLLFIVHGSITVWNSR